MFFEIIKDSFDLWSRLEQKSLPWGTELFLLAWVWWRQNEAAVLTPYLPSHDTGSVTTIPDSDGGCVVDKVWYLLRIAHARRRESNSR